MSDWASVVEPIITEIGFTSVGVPLASSPAETGGLVSPNPVPKSDTISPGLAGDAPGTTVGFATIPGVVSFSAATLVELGIWNNAGAKACSELNVPMEL